MPGDAGCLLPRKVMGVLRFCYHHQFMLGDMLGACQRCRWLPNPSPLGLLLSACLSWLMEAHVHVQDKFFTQLRSSADGFAVIAEFFGRGILNSTASASS